MALVSFAAPCCTALCHTTPRKDLPLAPSSKSPAQLFLNRSRETVCHGSFTVNCIGVDEQQQLKSLIRGASSFLDHTVLQQLGVKLNGKPEEDRVICAAACSTYGDKKVKDT